MDKIEVDIDTLRAAYENSTPEMRRFLEYTFKNKCSEPITQEGIIGSIKTPVKRVYICGKISGLHVDEVRQKFEQAEKLIIEQGHIPVNPTKNGLSHNASWEQHMALDITLLMGCDAIYLLPDWEDSRGARIEKNIAKLTGKEMIFEQADK